MEFIITVATLVLVYISIEQKLDNILDEIRKLYDKNKKIMKEYIDLGLPSGTLWCSENEEGYHTYDKAVEKFGDNLPTKEQFDELIDECVWVWNDVKKGFKVVGSNGNSIFLPAAGFIGCDGSWVAGC